MALEGVIPNITGMLSFLPEDFAESLSWLNIVIQAVGVLIIIYIIFLITKWIINFNKARRIKRIDKNVKLIDSKMDRVLKKLKIRFDPDKDSKKETKEKTDKKKLKEKDKK